MSTATKKTVIKKAVDVPQQKKQAVKKPAHKAAVKPATVAKVEVNPSALGERAMLVSMTIRRWHPHITDKQISDKVAEDHNAKHDAGKYRKRVLPKEALFKLASIGNKLRALHYYRTLPWTDEGYRILSSAGYLEYTEKARQLIDQYNEEWQTNFLPNYQQFKDDWKVRTGSMYKEEDYPPVSALKEKFGVDISIRPLPTAEDFRVQVGDDEVKRIRKSIEEESKKTVEAAMKEVWGRLRDVVAHMAERLNAYKVTEDGTEGKFRDSLVGNIAELLDVVPSLNLTQDPALDQFAADIRKRLTAVTATVLRDDETVRKATAAAAEDILAKMAGYLA